MRRNPRHALPVPKLAHKLVALREQVQVQLVLVLGALQLLELSKGQLLVATAALPQEGAR